MSETCGKSSWRGDIQSKHTTQRERESRGLSVWLHESITNVCVVISLCIVSQTSGAKQSYYNASVVVVPPPFPPFSLFLLHHQEIVDFTSISASGDYMRFPAARDVACQTDAPRTRAVGTQLSAKTLRPFLGRKGLYPHLAHLLFC